MLLFMDGSGMLHVCSCHLHIKRSSYFDTIQYMYYTIHSYLDIEQGVGVHTEGRSLSLSSLKTIIPLSCPAANMFMEG